MEPMTLALLMSAGTAAVKTGIGAAQAAKGKKLAKGAVRPEKEIPSAVEEYLANVKAMAANKRLPGQGALEQKIGASSASGIRQATQGASSSAALMAAIGGIKGEEQSQLADVGVKSAGFQDLNQQRLQDALLKYGGAQDDVFEANEMEPFKDEAAAAEALTGAGMQNIVGGIEQGAGTAGMAAFGGGRTKAPIPGATTPATGGTPGGLGTQTNTQKYLNAKKTGFSGSYNDWLTKQSLSGGLNFPMIQ